MPRTGHLAVATMALMVACGPSPQDVKEIDAQQKEIDRRLADLTERLDTLSKARPTAAAPTAPDLDRVYELPVGDSPFQGPAAAQVAIVEFADFQ